MNPLALNLLQKTPIHTSIVQSPNLKKSDQGIESDFKSIFSEELNLTQKNTDVNLSIKSSKIDKIKEKIANSYYLKPDISEIIAEKLMNNWT